MTKVIEIKFLTEEEVKAQQDSLYWEKNSLLEFPNDPSMEKYRQAQLAHRQELVLRLGGATQDGWHSKSSTSGGCGSWKVFTTIFAEREWHWKIEQHAQYFVSFSPYENGNGYDCSEVFWEKDGEWFCAPCVKGWSCMIRRFKGSIENGFGEIAVIP